jgi:hypothetical protein
VLVRFATHDVVPLPGFGFLASRLPGFSAPRISAPRILGFADSRVLGVNWLCIGKKGHQVAEHEYRCGTEGKRKDDLGIPERRYLSGFVKCEEGGSGGGELGGVG